MEIRDLILPVVRYFTRKLEFVSSTLSMVASAHTQARYTAPASSLAPLTSPAANYGWLSLTKI